MSKQGIVNIINFIRAVEPRNPELDLLEPVVNQIRLVEEHGLAATWLIQYDALLESRFVDLLKNLDSMQEIGVWFEIPQQLVEKAGMKWRGRPGFSWDWHTDCGFSVGYTPAEREKLADIVMEDFKGVFGKYPASVGAWLIDAHLLGYLADKYGVIASCNCKDQYGTDGYTMWGGYYNQAYYPSRRNAFMPAQHASEQIPIPIFRMLGSDPIYQYSVDPNAEAQGVVSLEPVYKDGGGSPDWIRWFFDVNYKAPSVSFGYAQVGQENSFGWEAMKDGLAYQLEHISKLAGEGILRIESLEDSAKWFKSEYEVTPASAITALVDWKNERHKSVWYGSRFYRANLYWEQDEFNIRDIHLFDETYQERYLTEVCTSHNAVYDTLPICDGFMWSDESYAAGIRLVFTAADGSRRVLSGADPQVEEGGENLTVKWSEEDGTRVQVTCGPGSLDICVNPTVEGSSWLAEMTWAKAKNVPISQVDQDRIGYVHNGHSYEVVCLAGALSRGDDGTSIQVIPVSNSVSLGFEARA